MERRASGREGLPYHNGLLKDELKFVHVRTAAVIPAPGIFFRGTVAQAKLVKAPTKETRLDGADLRK